LKIEIIPVGAWGGVRVDNSRLTKRTAQGIVIHHTADANRPPFVDALEEDRYAKDRARQIQKFHMGSARGWRDSGHHFLVSKGGVILEGRNGTLAAAEKGLVLRGSHAGDNEANQRRWGIETEGTFILEEPHPLQWGALVQLCAWLSFVGKTQSSQIEGHRHYKATACPGDALFRALPRLRHDVREAKLKLMEGR
jgi:hypothetical protein